MSKQIYIDSNGNEVLVSGTVANAGNLPLGSDFSDPTSTAGAIASKADKIATGSHTVYGVWSDTFYGSARFWVAFPNADKYTITLTSTKYRSADTTMTSITGATIAVKNDCGFLVAGDASAVGHYGEIVFTTA